MQSVKKIPAFYIFKNWKTITLTVKEGNDIIINTTYSKCSEQDHGLATFSKRAAFWCKVVKPTNTSHLRAVS